MAEGELASFYKELMAEVSATATANGEFTRVAFVENFVRRLVEAEAIQDWVPCFHEGKGSKNRAIALDGYSEDDLAVDGSMCIIIADCRESEHAEVLNTSDVSWCLSRASGFVLDARAGRLHDSLEPSTPKAELARKIYELGASIKTVRVMVLSNAAFGPRYRDVERTSVDGVRIEQHVWDLTRLFQLASTGGREELDLDVTAYVRDGLPALPAGIGDTGYLAYLCVVPGSFLADIY